MKEEQVTRGNKIPIWKKYVVPQIRNSSRIILHNISNIIKERIKTTWINIVWDRYVESTFDTTAVQTNHHKQPLKNMNSINKSPILLYIRDVSSVDR